MLSSIYRQLLLVILISPLTKVSAYNTPWPSETNHVYPSNESPFPPDSIPSPSTITILEGPPTTAYSGLSALAAPVDIHPSLALAHTTSLLPCLPCRLHRIALRHLSPIIFGRHLFWNTTTTSADPCSKSVSTASPLSPHEPRAALSTPLVLSSTHGEPQQNRPETRVSTGHNTGQHNTTHSPTSRPIFFLSRLVVLRAILYGIPQWEFQISKFWLPTRTSTCLVQIAANLVKAPLPPLDLHKVSPSSSTTTFASPPPSPSSLLLLKHLLPFNLTRHLLVLFSILSTD